MLDVLKDWYGLILVGLGAFAWFIRVESRGLANEREIKRLWAQRKEDLHSAEAARRETAEMLKEIRGDIKTLLSKGH